MERRGPIKFRFGKERSAGNIRVTPPTADRPGLVAEGVPLAQLIKRELVPAPEIVMAAQARSIYAERYRRLKTTLAHSEETRLSVIVVSSGAPGEGKSTVSINLALTYASEMDQRVLLIDADLRHPALSKYIKPEPQIGLSHVVSGQADEEHAILRLKETSLEFLPAGETRGDPLKLLSSSAMKQFIGKLRERYDHIIIDTPPLVPFADADEIGSCSDGLILVVRSGVTPVPVIRQAISSVTSAPVLGIVLNDVRSGSLADWGKSRSGHYDKHYASYYSERRNGD